MGVIHKLRPEVKNCIIEEKKNNPLLSCRGISKVLEERFQIKVSKSSINAIIKELGLSMPVGRRQKRKKIIANLPIEPLVEVVEIKEEIKEEILQEKIKEEIKLEAPERIEAEIPPETAVEEEYSGLILLRAADAILGGVDAITKAISSHTKSTPQELLFAKTESLLYDSLANPGASNQDISTYLNDLQQVTALPTSISQILLAIFQEALGVRVTLSDGSIFYLDGQLHTIWSSAHLPYSFSITTYKIKSYIKKYFQEDTSIVLFMAPGYDTPTGELFDFIAGFNGEKAVAKITLYGNKFEDLETITLTEQKKRHFILGLWPWQYVEYRKVRIKEDFREFNFVPLGKKFYIAEAEVTLLQPNVNKEFTLRGCALKCGLNEKVKLAILSNLAPEDSTLEELTGSYLSRWPNLEEALQDYNRKVELFTYTAVSQRVLSTEKLLSTGEFTDEIKSLMSYYLKALDLFVKWYFLPAGYEDQGFATINGRFYNLKGRLKREKDLALFTFMLPQNYPFAKDLAYALQRINEQEVILGDGKRLWLAV